MNQGARTTAELAHDLEVLNQIEGSIRRQKLERIAELQRRQVWRNDGAKDMAEWVAARCDESRWRSRRWVDAAQAIESLPQIRRALPRGALSLDKVCELTRFATPETEAGLVAWAASVSLATVKRKADRATADPIEETRADDAARFLSWWFEDDRRLHLEGMLPAEQGAQVVKALERLADRLPSDPDAERASTVDARRADALVALASQSITDDAHSVRARVNLHVDLDALVARDGSGLLESNGVVHPEVASMLCCDSIVQAIVHGDGAPHGRHRTGFAQRPGMALPPAPRARRGLHLPGLSSQPLRQGASHLVVGVGRSHGLGRPGVGV